MASISSPIFHVYAPAIVEEGFEFYNGFLYVHAPFDEADADFKKLSVYLDHPDGTSRYDDIVFAYYSLEKALKKAPRRTMILG